MYCFAQLEAYWIIVDDKGFQVRKKEGMIIHGSYIHSINVCSTLISMKMSLPIDSELGVIGPKALPKTIIISDLN